MESKVHAEATVRTVNVGKDGIVHSRHKRETEMHAFQFRTCADSDIASTVSINACSRRNMCDGPSKLVTNCLSTERTYAHRRRKPGNKRNRTDLSPSRSSHKLQRISASNVGGCWGHDATERLPFTRHGCKEFFEQPHWHCVSMKSAPDGPPVQFCNPLYFFKSFDK